MVEQVCFHTWFRIGLSEVDCVNDVAAFLLFACQYIFKHGLGSSEIDGIEMVHRGHFVVFWSFT